MNGMTFRSSLDITFISASACRYMTQRKWHAHGKTELPLNYRNTAQYSAVYCQNTFALVLSNSRIAISYSRSLHSEKEYLVTYILLTLSLVCYIPPYVDYIVINELKVLNLLSNSCCHWEEAVIHHRNRPTYSLMKERQQKITYTVVL